VDADVRAQLAPTGTLRAAINYNNPLLARRAETGELVGVAVDLTRALGERADLPVQLIPYSSANDIATDATAGAWDVAFMASDPARADHIEFTPPYIELEATYLVPAGSPLARVEDVDREGVRIAMTRKSAYDLYLTRELKRAEAVRTNTTPESVQLMVTHQLDALAGLRSMLMAAADEIEGAVVLDGRFMTIPQAVGVPRGRPAATRYASEFIETAKESGFVAGALRRHGLTANDAIVAPPHPR